MLHSRLTKSKLIEICASSTIEVRALASPCMGIRTDLISGSIDAYWNEESLSLIGIPVLVVTADDEMTSILTAIAANPSIPSPFTALCRVINLSSVKTQFERGRGDIDDRLLAVLAILSAAEATLQAPRHEAIRSLTISSMRKTLSFSCARVLSVGCASESFAGVLARWFDVFYFTSRSLSDETQGALSNLSNILSLLVGIDQPSDAPSSVNTFVSALWHNGLDAISDAWKTMVSSVSLSMSLESITSSNREEKAALLKHVLGDLRRSPESDELTIACAFIATRVAPASLEHFQLLRMEGGPRVALWYTVIAAMQAPQPILRAFGGFPTRILRDIVLPLEVLARPTCDISYDELDMLARIGIDEVSKRFGHPNEVAVELFPLADATFSVSLHQARSAVNSAPQRQLELEAYPSDSLGRNSSKKLEAAIALLMELRFDDDKGVSGRRGADPSSTKRAKRKS